MGRLWMLALGICVFAGCADPGPTLKAGEALIPADEKDFTSTYVAELPEGWVLDQEDPTEFTLFASRSKVSVLVYWNPTPPIQEIIGESPEEFYQMMIKPELDRGGTPIKFGGFSGVVSERQPQEIMHGFFGKHNISLTVQNGMSFIMINAQNNDDDITREQVINFAKSIRKP